MNLREIAELTQSELKGDPDYTITGVADLESASPTDLSFLAKNPYGTSSYSRAVKNTTAGAIFISPDIEPQKEGNFLITENPSQAFQQVVEHFQPKIASGFSGIHETAVVHPTAKLGEHVTLGPYVVVDREATIGSNTTISAHGFVGAQTSIGEDCLLYPRVTIREGCRIGNRVVIQPGVVIGGCGFGFTSSAEGIHAKIEQLGSVTVGDDVEIGANTTIDRARLSSTTIGQGSKLDNLVQIAHGVQVGDHNLIVGQTGIAGSAKTGRNVVLAGQVAVNGHIEICAGAIVAARSGVMQSIKKPGKYVGEPAQPYEDYRRHFMHLMRIERYAKRLKALEDENR